MPKDVGNKCCIRTDWKCKQIPPPPAEAGKKQLTVLQTAALEGPQFYWKRTAGRRLHALGLRISTGALYMVHFYLVLGQNCTCAAATFLGDPYAFHTCSKNTINTGTTVLYIAQFGLEVQWSPI